MVKRKNDELQELSERRKMFCKEFIIDFNCTKAAERSGYSRKTANEQGSRLLANVSIQQEISKLIKVREQRTNVKADNVYS